MFFKITCGNCIYFCVWHRINPLATDNTPLCGWKFETVKYMAMPVISRNIFSRFSSNSETFRFRIIGKSGRNIVECGLWTLRELSSNYRISKGLIFIFIQLSNCFYCRNIEVLTWKELILFIELRRINHYCCSCIDDQSLIIE